MKMAQAIIGVEEKPDEETVAKITEAMQHIADGNESEGDRELLISMKLMVVHEPWWNPATDPVLITIV